MRPAPAQVGLKLIEVRGKQSGFIEESFPTIAGAGPNGAIIHYRAVAGADRSINADTLLLLDSGAQYDCGARAGSKRPTALLMRLPSEPTT